MTSNAASDEIKANSGSLRLLTDATEGRPQEYLRVIREFNQRIYPVLKREFKRDEFIGRINQTIVFLPLNDEEVVENCFGEAMSKQLIKKLFQIYTVINGELRTWKMRAAKKHAIHVDWTSEGMPCFSSFKIDLLRGI